MINVDYAKTFAVLFYRNVQFIYSELYGRMIDGTIIVIMQTFAIGQLLPLLGMPPSMIAPLFIGTITQIVFSAAYGISFRYVNDLQKDKFINYQLLLPLPKRWLFAQIITTFMIEVAFISLPLIFLGSIFLGSSFEFSNTNWLGCILMYMLSLIFYALLFIYLAFSSPYTWFLDNVWARRLSPLFLLGCAYYTWKQLYAFNTPLAILTLLNPLTYVHEGLRSAILGNEPFIPLAICILMLILFCILLVVLLTRAIAARLDPV